MKNLFENTKTCCKSFQHLRPLKDIQIRKFFSRNPNTISNKIGHDSMIA